MIKYISLFSGIGAPEKALEKLNIPYELLGFSEIDKFAIKSYCKVHNVDESLNLGDITKIDINTLPTDIDLITHGSPCQDFSVAGKGLGGDKGSNTRSSLMWNTVAICEHCKPKYVIWENVKNVLSKKHRHNFDKYLDEMDRIGYNNYFKILNAKDYGIPQNRERIFVISIRKDIDKEFIFPKPFEEEVKLRDFLEGEVDEKFYISSEKTEKIISEYKGDFLTTQDRHGILVGDYRYDEGLRIRKNNLCPCITCKVGSSSLSGNPFVIYKVKQATKKGYDLALEGDSTNLEQPNSHQVMVQNYKIRKLTPKECWRLMGFEDEDFNKAAEINSNTQLYKQAGNSIVVNVLVEIFKQLFN